MTATPARRSLNWIPIVILMVVVLTALFWACYFRESMRWNKFLLHQEERKARAMLEPAARESLIDATEPGNAMAEYDRETDPAKVGKWSLGGYQFPSMGQVRAGARKSHCAISPLFLKIYPDPSNVLGGKVPFEDALSMAQMGIDFAGSPRLFTPGLVCIHEALHAIVDSGESLDRIEAAVAKIDRNFPSMATSMDRTGYLIGAGILEKGAPAVRFTWKPFFFRTDPPDSFEFDEIWTKYVDILRRGESTEWKLFEAEYVKCMDSMRGKSHRSFWDAGEYYHAPWGRCEGLAHVRVVHAALMARHGARPGSPGWPVNPVTMKPVQWDDAAKEASCDEMHQLQLGAGRCWRRGNDLVFKLP